MKILQLCNRMPWPPKDGGAIHLFNFTKSCGELGVDLTLLAINTPKHFVEVNDLPREMRQWADVHAVPVDTRVKAGDAFKNLFSNESYNISRFDSPAVHEKLRELLQAKEYDVVHVDGLFVSMYTETIRKYSKAKVVMRAHNVEYRIWERLAESEPFWPKKQYLRLLAKRLKAYEAGVLNDFDALLPISEVDRQELKRLGARVPQYVMTAGVDPEVWKPQPQQPPMTLFHIGSMDWMPNRQAVEWFLEVVWPKLHRQFPELRVYLAGRHMPQHLLQSKTPGLMVVGEVPDAVEFMNSHAIMIVPLLSGSGMRLKIIEGMALGKVIVSTSVGAEGIAYEDGKHLLIADDAAAFAEAVAKLVQQPELVKSTGAAARELVQERYTNRQIVAKLLDFYERLER